MRVVIYDEEDMEPITVIRLPDGMGRFLEEIERGERGHELVFAVQTPLRPSDFREIPLETFKVPYVKIRFEQIWKSDGAGRRKRLMWLATTRDGESALLLKSVFLPGQQGEVNRQREDAFLAGLFAALAR